MPTLGLNHKKGTDFTVYPADERSVTPRTVFMVFDAESYEQMTGAHVDLTGNQVILFAHNKALKGQKAVHYQWARLPSQGRSEQGFYH